MFEKTKEKTIEEKGTWISKQGDEKLEFQEEVSEVDALFQV